MRDNSSPLAGLYQFADLAFDEVTLKRADVADVELPVEMIGFMEESSGKQVLAGLFVELPIHVLSADGDDPGPGDGLAKFRNAEAAFVLALPSFSVNDLGIGKNEFRVGIFFECDIDYGESLRDTDLWGGESYTMRGIHGLEHIVDELLQVVVEVGNRFGRPFEYRVAVFDDGIDHAAVIGRSSSVVGEANSAKSTVLAETRIVWSRAA
jgi:hypothetical protein